MKRYQYIYLSSLFFIFILSGCVVRTYTVTKDRVDQDLTAGNRGYLQGEAPQENEQAEKKTTRTIKVVEVELHSPLKFDKAPAQEAAEESPKAQEDSGYSGNRGYINRSQTQEEQTANSQESQEYSGDMQQYTVEKNDTLQKISQKIYGTSKKWIKIYNANKDSLKGPNKIYPGQVINIPVEANNLKEEKSNLK